MCRMCLSREWLNEEVCPHYVHSVFFHPGIPLVSSFLSLPEYQEFGIITTQFIGDKCATCLCITKISKIVSSNKYDKTRVLITVVT